MITDPGGCSCGLGELQTLGVLPKVWGSFSSGFLTAEYLDCKWADMIGVAMLAPQNSGSRSQVYLVAGLWGDSCVNKNIERPDD